MQRQFQRLQQKMSIQEQTNAYKFAATIQTKLHFKTSCIYVATKSYQATGRKKCNIPKYTGQHGIK